MDHSTGLLHPSAPRERPVVAIQLKLQHPIEPSKKKTKLKKSCPD